MKQVERNAEPEADGTDRDAIAMMLSYVESECRRLGLEDAARYAALASTLVQGMTMSGPVCTAPRLAPLH